MEKQRFVSAANITEIESVSKLSLLFKLISDSILSLIQINF